MARAFSIVLAGGEGKRLWPLTADRAKPAVPFGGNYRLIDFALSNLVNGGFVRIAVLGNERLEKAKFFRAAMDPVNEAMFEIIGRRRGEPDLDARDDILSMLVQSRYEDGTPMSDQELRDELMTLLVAGHETTATALAWALERLVRNPEMLDRLRSGDEEYLDAVVTETLRRRPVMLRSRLRAAGRARPRAGGTSGRSFQWRAGRKPPARAAATTTPA